MSEQLTLPRNLRYTCRLTGRTRTLAQEFGRAIELPEAEIVSTHRVSEMAHFDGVAELNGEFYYLVEGDYLADPEPGCQARTLTKTVSNCLVAGRDVYDYETRTAPASTAGICAWPKGSQISFGDPIFAVVPPELHRVRRERAELVANRVAAEAAHAEYVAAHANWRKAWDACEVAKAATGRFYDLPERENVSRAYHVMARLKEAAIAACNLGRVRFVEAQ